MCPLWLLSRHLPHLQGARRGDGLAARAHLFDERAVAGRSAPGFNDPVHRPLLGVYGLCHRLSVGGAIWRVVGPLPCRAETTQPHTGRTFHPFDGARDVALSHARFRLAATMGKFAKPIQSLLPHSLRAMLDLLPAALPPAQPTPDFVAAIGPRRARVAFLRGCVQTVLAPQINAATLRVLARNGVEVVIPQGQGCCGSLSMHTGEAAQARQLAGHNLGIFPQDVDVIVTNAAGCGSGMHEYGLLFAGTPQEAAAHAFAAKVKDVSVFLHELGLLAPHALAEPLTVAYHDACHLAHAQRVTAQPRQLLTAIPNLTLKEIADGEICCGSAGTYNLEQPAIARELGERKARNILATGAQAVVTGNIGCMTQIGNHLGAQGRCCRFGIRWKCWIGHMLTYTDNPDLPGVDDLEIVVDFLPRPEELLFLEPETEKITIQLDKRTVNYFRQKAQERGGSYQRMIRSLLNEYVNHQQEVA